MQSINKDVNMKDGIRNRVEQMEEIQSYSEICPPPKSLKLELSATCNLQCSFCFNSKGARRGLMSLSTFYKCMEIVRRNKIQQVGLLFLGESTLNPLLPKMISIAKEEYNVPYLFLTSNGLMEEDMYDAIMTSKLDSLKWSINHASREEFEKETNVDGFNIVLRHIQDKRKTNVKKYASTAVYDVENIPEELKSFIDNDVKPYVKEHYYFKLNNQGGLIQDEHFNINRCNRLPVIPCPRIFNNSYITYDGRVALCCSAFTDKYLIGDINEKMFEDIWNGREMVSLRKKHLSGDLTNTICNGDI